MRCACSTALAVLALALMVSAAVAQPAPAPIPAQPAEEGPKTLRLPLGGGGIHLDPHRTVGSNSLNLIGDVYEGLMQWTPGPQLAPCLAKEWPKVSADGLTYTFSIRTEAKFHNSPCFADGKGRTLKASDVVASIKHLAACSGEESNWFWLLKGWIKGLDEYADDCKTSGGFAGKEDVDVEGLQAPDDATFVLKLKRPCAAMMAILAHPALSIIAQEALGDFNSRLVTREVGTAPYRLNAVIEDRIYILKRFDDYWGDKPYFDRVTYSEPRQLQLVLSGQWSRFTLYGNDYRSYVKDGKLTAALARAGLEFDASEDEGSSFACFNMQDPIVGGRDADGRGLRKAIAMCLDLAAVLKDTYQTETYGEAYGRLSDELLPPGCEFAEVCKGDAWRKYDLKAAKDTLAATKFKGGKDPATGRAITLKLVIDSGSGSDTLISCFRMGLAELGIELESSTADREDYYAQLDKGEGQLFYYSWNLDYPVAQNIFQLFDSSNIGNGLDNRNVARYDNKDFDAAYAALQKLELKPENREQRKEQTRKLANLLLDDRVVIPMFVRKSPSLRVTAIDWPSIPQCAFDEARFIKAKK